MSDLLTSRFCHHQLLRTTIVGFKYIYIFVFNISKPLWRDRIPTHTHAHWVAKNEPKPLRINRVHQRRKRPLIAYACACVRCRVHSRNGIAHHQPVNSMRIDACAQFLWLESSRACAEHEWIAYDHTFACSRRNSPSKVCVRDMLLTTEKTRQMNDSFNATMNAINCMCVCVAGFVNYDAYCRDCGEWPHSN